MRKSSKCLSVLALCLLSLGLLLPGSQAQTSVQPFRTPAWQISVYSNAYRYPNGAGANWTYIRLGGDPTNLNVQAVFNWLDSNWIHVVDQQLSTNGWTFLMPTQSDVQAVFNWIDANMDTNYLTAETGSNLFISSVGGNVSNKHMAANAVTASNIVDGSIGIADIDASYLKMPRIAGYDAQGGNAICTACGAGAVGVVNTTQVTRSTLFGLYAYLAMTNVSVGADPLSLMYISAQISSNGTVWQTVDVGAAQVGFYTNSAAGGINFSSPAQIHWFVPASNYYKIEATAGSSLQAHQRWTCLWQRTFSVATGP